MLIELTQHDVANYWPEIRPKVIETLQGEFAHIEGSMSGILQRLQTGVLKAWLGYPEGDLSKIEYLALTGEIIDAGTAQKDLLIYALAGWNPVSNERWAEDFRIIAQYARARGCTRIVAETREKRLIELARQFGGRTDKVKVEFSLDAIEAGLN